MWHDSFIYVTCLIHTCDMTHSYMWHASFICVTYIYPGTSRRRYMCVSWLTHICDMTHLYVWHTYTREQVSVDIFDALRNFFNFSDIRVKRLCCSVLQHVLQCVAAHVAVCYSTCCSVWQHALQCISVQWGCCSVNVSTCKTTARENDLYIYMSCHTYEWVMTRIWTRHVTHICGSLIIHMNESCHIYEWVVSHICMRLHI